MQEFYGGESGSRAPMDIVQDWMDRAGRAGDIETNAVHLATVDESGLPDVRVVYIKEFEFDGVIFYTNYQSCKGEQLESGQAAINFYFPKWQRQIRLRGKVGKIPALQSDAYFLSRPAASRIGAWMSKQSQEVANRKTMEDALGEIDPRLASERPPYWGGYCLKPTQIEFWAGGEFRIHDRFRWVKEGKVWRVSRLYP